MEIKSKECSKCNVDKTLEQFNKRSSSKDGHRSECKECQSLSKRKWFSDNRERELEKAKSPEQREKYYSWFNEKYNTDPEWRANIRKNQNTYQKSEAALKRRRDWYMIPKNRVASNLRNRLRTALKNNTKSDATLILLGADIEFVNSYIESLFKEGMTWENYGKWHLDHIIPCEFFDFSKVEHQKLCFNYRNLQPMWAIDNFRKSDSLTIDNIDKFLENIREHINV